MEGRRPDLVCAVGADRPLQTLLKLLCRLIGKGNGNNIPRSRRIYRTQKLCTCAQLFGRLDKILPQQCKIVLGCTLRGIFTGISLSEPQQIDNAVDEHSGFAASCSCEDEQRAFRMKYCFCLLVIELRKFPLNDSRTHCSILNVEICLHGMLLIR